MRISHLIGRGKIAVQEFIRSIYPKVEGCDLPDYNNNNIIILLDNAVVSELILHFSQLYSTQAFEGSAWYTLFAHYIILNFRDISET